MKRERRNLFQRSASLMLAVVMVLSVIVVMPKDVKAAADKVLPAGGGTITITDQESVEAAYYNEYHWISYTAAKDGYLKLTFSNNTKIPEVGYSSGSVVLYDASKAAPLSNTMRYSIKDGREFATTEYYGVKKGVTYKIRVEDIGGVIINAQFKAIKKKLNNNLKKGKAITLKRGKKTDGIIQPGNSKSHFYKFKVTNSKKVKVTIAPYLTSDFYFDVWGPRLKKSKEQVTLRTANGTTNYNWGNKKCGTEISTRSGGKLTPGTYYIEVKPIGKTCNGYFSIKWK